LSGYRFLFLLVSLVLVFLAGPVIAAFAPAGNHIVVRATVSAFFVVMLMAAVYAVSRQRWTLVVALILVIPGAILQGVVLFWDPAAILIIHHFFLIAYLAFVVVVLIRFLFAGDRVTANTIYASLCVFLLFGITWSVGYCLIELLVPGSFAAAWAEPGISDFMRLGRGTDSAPLYFSLVTLTTLGYGDITPVSALARMCAALEAVTGQLYIAVLVARLVGMHIAQKTTPS
jgi:hypothetical protein